MSNIFRNFVPLKLTNQTPMKKYKSLNEIYAQLVRNHADANEVIQTLAKWVSEHPHTDKIRRATEIMYCDDETQKGVTIEWDRIRHLVVDCDIDTHPYKVKEILAYLIRSNYVDTNDLQLCVNTVLDASCICYNLASKTKYVFNNWVRTHQGVYYTSIVNHKEYGFDNESIIVTPNNYIAYPESFLTVYANDFSPNSNTWIWGINETDKIKQFNKVLSENLCNIF